MKKLVLKKDIVARINGGEMNKLRGGETGYTIDSPTCGHTCNPDPSCPNLHTCEYVSCVGTCNHLCGSDFACYSAGPGCYTGETGGMPGTAAECVTTGTMIQCM